MVPLDRLLKDQVVDLRGKPEGDTCKGILQAVMRYFGGRQLEGGVVWQLQELSEQAVGDIFLGDPLLG